MVFTFKRRRKLKTSPAVASAIADGLDPSAYWLRADPVSLMPDLTNIYMIGNSQLQITADEQAQWLSLITPYLEGYGMELVIPHPVRWYLRVSERPEMVTFSPQSLEGKSIREILLHGKQSTFYLKLFTEIQMLLYDSVTNHRRVAQGLPTVDALWFWGA